MAKTNQTTVTLVTVVEGLTTATEALNTTAKAIFELVTGEAEAVAPAKTPASKKAVKESEPEVDTDGADDLEEMTIQDLRKKAKELGLKAGGSKVSLIEAIREELDGAEDEEEEEEDETEDSEEESEDDEEEEEIDLEELSADELVSFIEENELGDVPAKKKKEKAEAYADRLRAFIEEALADEEEEEEEADEEDEDSEEEDDEEEEEVELEELSDEELVALAEENEVDVPYTGKGKKKKLDREALIEALEEVLGEEDEDEEDEEDESEDDEDEEELTPEDLEEMSDDELKELAEDFEIEIGKKFNRKKAIKALIEYMESDDEDEE